MNSSPRIRIFRRLAIAASACGVLLAETGCATTGEALPPSPRSFDRPAVVGESRGAVVRSGASLAASTGRVFTKADMHRHTSTHYFGDETYAEVNSEWLKQYYKEFRAELHRLGVMRWDERFDCNRFAELYVSLAQARFFRESFHARSAARALAIGPFWYVRDNGHGSHAVVQALTERGRIFIDPQNGEEVQLTKDESTTFAYFQFF